MSKTDEILRLRAALARIGSMPSTATGNECAAYVARETLKRKSREDTAEPDATPEPAPDVVAPPVPVWVPPEVQPEQETLGLVTEVSQ